LWDIFTFSTGRRLSRCHRSASCDRRSSGFMGGSGSHNRGRASIDNLRVVACGDRDCRARGVGARQRDDARNQRDAVVIGV
jgi:hypothetical protein